MVRIEPFSGLWVTVGVFDSESDSGKLQVLRVKISGGLEKCLWRPPPVVDEKRVVDFISGDSVMFRGGGGGEGGYLFVLKVETVKASNSRLMGEWTV